MIMLKKLICDMKYSLCVLSLLQQSACLKVYWRGLCNAEGFFVKIKFKPETISCNIKPR